MPKIKLSRLEAFEWGLKKFSPPPPSYSLKIKKLKEEIKKNPKYEAYRNCIESRESNRGNNPDSRKKYGITGNQYMEIYLLEKEIKNIEIEKNAIGVKCLKCKKRERSKSEGNFYNLCDICIEEVYKRNWELKKTIPKLLWESFPNCVKIILKVLMVLIILSYILVIIWNFYYGEYGRALAILFFPPCIIVPYLETRERGRNSLW